MSFKKENILAFEQSKFAVGRNEHFTLIHVQSLLTKTFYIGESIKEASDQCESKHL